MMVLKQFIKFGLVGAVNSVLNYIIYAICIRLGMHYILANIIGFIIVIFNAYLLQNRFVFKENSETEHRVWWKVLIKTYMSYAFTGLILVNILSFLWLDVLDLTGLIEPVYMVTKQYFGWRDTRSLLEYIAPILNMIVTIPINFLINKFWTYRQK